MKGSNTLTNLLKLKRIIKRNIQPAVTLKIKVSRRLNIFFIGNG